MRLTGFGGSVILKRCGAYRMRAGPARPLFRRASEATPATPARRCSKIEREARINERIRAREVRLIDENGAQLGIMSSQQALQIARQRDLDLIEVAPGAQPPVCRIMDFGKHKYEMQKKEREGA